MSIRVVIADDQHAGYSGMAGRGRRGSGRGHGAGPERSR